MKTINLTVNKGWLPFADALDSLQPFKTHGALRGLEHDPSRSVNLVGKLADRYLASNGQLSTREVDYLVYSYETPIAWHTDRSGWLVPAGKYSITTTDHQHLISLAVDNPPGSAAYRRQVAWEKEFGSPVSPAWGVGGFGKGR